MLAGEDFAKVGSMLTARCSALHAVALRQMNTEGTFPERSRGCTQCSVFKSG